MRVIERKKPGHLAARHVVDVFSFRFSRASAALPNFPSCARLDPERALPVAMKAVELAGPRPERKKFENPIAWWQGTCVAFREGSLAPRPLA